jgi:uncharacterized Zn finger protein
MSQKHGATWWSGRFLRSLERLGMTTRLKKGHVCFQQGRVVDIEIESGVVRSVVKEKEEFYCQIFFEPLSAMEWNESLDRLAFADLSAAALLTVGRMPPQIEDFFVPSGRRLLPQAESDLELHCSCCAQEEPCRHLAATAYALAEKLDSDPWLLFLLRGLSAEEVENALVERWNRDFNAEEQLEPQSENSLVDGPDNHNVDLFWANHLQSPIHFPPSVKPLKGVTLERMAIPEPKIDTEAWKHSLRALYEQVSERAQELSD